MNWGQTNIKKGRNKGIVVFPIFVSHFSFPLLSPPIFAFPRLLKSLLSQEPMLIYKNPVFILPDTVEKNIHRAEERDLKKRGKKEKLDMKRAAAAFCRHLIIPSMLSRIFHRSTDRTHIYAWAVLAAWVGFIFFPSLLYRILGGGARLRRPSRERTLEDIFPESVL